MGRGEFGTPPHKALLHWTADEPTSAMTQDRGVSFAVEVLPRAGERGRIEGVGWVALGWSPTHPPQMLDSEAVLGYIDEADEPQVGFLCVWCSCCENVCVSMPGRWGGGEGLCSVRVLERGCGKGICMDERRASGCGCECRCCSGCVPSCARMCMCISVCVCKFGKSK